jgi:hypothetical protein
VALIPHPQGWWEHHILRWWIWMPATGLLGLSLWWTRDRRREAVPWIFLGLLLASIVLHYVGSGWGVYFSSRPVWLAGVATIIGVSLEPLLVCLLVDAALRRVPTRPGARAAIAATIGILAVFLTQTWIWHRIQPIASWLTLRQ